MGELTFHKVQRHAVPTIKLPDNPLYAGLALAGEVGEMLNIRKKIERDEGGRERTRMGKIPDRDMEFLEEAGDVIFYLRLSLLERGFTLEDAGLTLLDKLDRMKREGEESG